MDVDKLQSHMQYVERNGNTLNIEEKMKMTKYKVYKKQLLMIALEKEEED